MQNESGRILSDAATVFAQVVYFYCLHTPQAFINKLKPRDDGGG